MRPRWIALGGLALAGLIAAVAVSGADETDPPVPVLSDDPEVLADGMAVYAATCAACHGAALEGEPDWQTRGDDGLMPAPPHDESGHTWHHDAESLFRITKYGLAALLGDPDYQTAMPVYENVLTDEEIISVLSWIRSTWPDEIREKYDRREAQR